MYSDFQMKSSIIEKNRNMKPKFFISEKLLSDVKSNFQKKSIFLNQNYKMTLISLFCLVGSFLRIYYYLLNRSLWLDEAMLAINIINRTWRNLFQPLDYHQATPLGFLFLEKLAVTLFGNSEYSLRLIPLISGLFSVLLIYIIARKFMTGVAPYLALGLFCFTPKLVYYSSEVKQYSSDVLCTLLLILFFLKCITDDHKPQTIIHLCIIGSLSIWISHPSFFILIAILITLIWSYFKRKDLTLLLYIIGSGVIWFINFGITYLISLRHLVSSNSLISYWSNGFAPFPPWKDPGWFIESFKDLLNDPMGLPENIIIIFLLFIGIFSLAQKKQPFLSIFIFTFILILSASSVQKYPFQGRLILFLVPLLLIVLSEAIEWVYSSLQPLNRLISLFITFGIIIYIFIFPIKETMSSYLLNPSMGEHIRPVVSYIIQNRQEEDLIYIYFGAVPAFQFYAPRFNLGREDYISGVYARQKPELYIRDILSLRDNKRVWFVFSHNCSWCIVNEQQYYLDYLNTNGQLLSEYFSEGAAVYLYDLTSQPLRLQYYAVY